MKQKELEINNHEIYTRLNCGHDVEWLNERGYCKECSEPSYARPDLTYKTKSFRQEEDMSSDLKRFPICANNGKNNEEIE